MVFALASETGDSIRLTASYAGVVGFKPTYGLISRYGLFAYGPSLDTIGIMANYVADCAIVFDNIIGQDQRDYTSITSSETNYFTNLTSQINGYKIAYIQEIIDELPVHLKIEFDKIITLLKKQGCQVTVINFPIDLIKAIPIIYMIISYVEAISCLANLNGITFSQRPDHYEDFTALINHSRRDFMGKTVKRRHVIGSYILKYEPALIDKAKQIRRLISNQFNELLAQYDVIISPGSGNVAPLITDVINYQRSADDLHQNLINHSILLSNFNGAPSLNVP